MKAYLIPGVILTVIVTVLVIAFGSWDFNTPNTVSVNFPEKQNHRVVLNPADSKEMSRIEYRKDDGTRVIAEIQYTNGVTSYVFYHPAGNNRAKVLDLYPAESEGQVDRKPKSETHFAADGETMTKHTVYREDGTVERRGERQTDGKYKTVYLAKDGSRVELERLFDEDADLFHEVAYFEDGTKRLETTKSGYELTTTTFRKDGTRFSVVKNGGVYSTHKGTFFWEDGETIKAIFADYSWRLEMQYHDKNGVISHKVDYYEERMEVQTFEPGNKDKVLFEQEFKLVGDKTSHCDGTYVLAEVKEFNQWGSSRYQYKTKLTIEMDDKGNPARIVVPTNKSLKYIYSLDENLVVTKVDKKGDNTGYGSGSSRNPAVEYKVGDKVDIDPDMLSQKTFECLTIPEKLKTETPDYSIYGPF